MKQIRDYFDDIRSRAVSIGEGKLRFPSDGHLTERLLAVAEELIEQRDELFRCLYEENDSKPFRDERDARLAKIMEGEK